MKVCVDARVSTRGGTSTFIQNYLRELGATSTPHEIHLVCSRDQTLLGGVARAETVVPHRHRALEFQWSQLRLPSLLKQKGLVLYHSLKHVGPVVCGAGTMYRVPAVGQFYGNYPMRSLEHIYWRHLGGYVYKRADLLVAVSDYIRRGLLEHLGIPEERIAVVYNGVDPRFRPLEPDESARASWRSKGIVPGFFLCVGNLLPVKNFATALNAYALLRQRFRDTPPLVLAGGQKHSHHAELRALVADHGIEDHVRFLEFQSPNDLLQLYNGARLLLHPSFHEGFSLTILEAMACGLPIVASSNTSIPEAAGDAALYVENPNDGEAFADHLQKVMSDDELAATLSRRALDRVSRFSWRRCVRETLALYGRFG